MIDFHHAGNKVKYICHICAPNHHHTLLYTLAVYNGVDRLRLRHTLSHSIWRVYAQRFCPRRMYDEQPYAFAISWVRALEYLCDSLPPAKVHELANKAQMMAKQAGARCEGVLGVIGCFVGHLRCKQGGYEVLGPFADVLELVQGRMWDEQSVDTRMEWEIKALRDAKFIPLWEAWKVEMAEWLVENRADFEEWGKNYTDQKAAWDFRFEAAEHYVRETKEDLALMGLGY